LPVFYTSAIFQIVKPKYDNQTSWAHLLKGLSFGPGAYAATLTFFKPNTEELDLVTLKKHVTGLGQQDSQASSHWDQTGKQHTSLPLNATTWSEQCVKASTMPDSSIYQPL
jgi:hypothetical protein